MYSVDVSVSCRHHETDAADKVEETATGSSAFCHFLRTTNTHTRAHTSFGHFFWPHRYTHTCLTLSQSVDDNLVEELRKCFIMQLLPEDIACVPTVHKAEGQMWPITLHSLTGQISLSDLSLDRLTQYSRITIHIWIHLDTCVCVCVQAISLFKNTAYTASNTTIIVPTGIEFKREMHF